MQLHLIDPATSYKHEIIHPQVIPSIGDEIQIDSNYVFKITERRLNFETDLCTCRGVYKLTWW
jgi:hypothetical protein